MMPIHPGALSLLERRPHRRLAGAWPEAFRTSGFDKSTMHMRGPTLTDRECAEWAALAGLPRNASYVRRMGTALFGSGICRGDGTLDPAAEAFIVDKAARASSRHPVPVTVYDIHAPDAASFRRSHEHVLNDERRLRDRRAGAAETDCQRCALSPADEAALFTTLQPFPDHTCGKWGKPTLAPIGPPPRGTIEGRTPDEIFARDVTAEDLLDCPWHRGKGSGVSWIEPFRRGGFLVHYGGVECQIIGERCYVLVDSALGARVSKLVEDRANRRGLAVAFAIAPCWRCHGGELSPALRCAKCGVVVDTRTHHPVNPPGAPNPYPMGDETRESRKVTDLRARVNYQRREIERLAAERDTANQVARKAEEHAKFSVEVREAAEKVSIKLRQDLEAANAKIRGLEETLRHRNVEIGQVVDNNLRLLKAEEAANEAARKAGYRATNAEASLKHALAGERNAIEDRNTARAERDAAREVVCEILDEWRGRELGPTGDIVHDWNERAGTDWVPKAEATTFGTEDVVKATTVDFSMDPKPTTSVRTVPVIRSTLDARSCPTCRATDGLIALVPSAVPVAGCTDPDGCRCRVETVNYIGTPSP